MIAEGAAERDAVAARPAGEASEGAGAPTEKEGAAANGPAAEPEAPRRRRTVKARLVEPLPKEPEWEQAESGDERADDRARPEQKLVWGAVAATLLMLGLAMVIVFLGGNGAPGTTEERAGTEPEPAWNNDEDDEAVDPGLGQVELDSALVRIEACVRRFLEAGSVEEMARHARGGQAVRARMEEYYERNEYAPTAFRAIAPDGRVQVSDDLWSVDVDLRDGPPRAIAVEETEAGFLVDWESWVGYSEMAWEEFLEKKPTEPRLFRVLCGTVDYYNYEFADDGEWESFRIVSPDRAHTVYGYLPRYSLAGRLLRDEGRNGGLQAFRVRLKFPEPSSGPDQVLIAEVVNSGWVGDVD